jgi:hypothetical protein
MSSWDINERIRREHLRRGKMDVEPKRYWTRNLAGKVEKQLLSTGMCEKHVDGLLYFTESFSNVLALAMGYFENRTVNEKNGELVCPTLEAACRKAVLYYLRTGTRPNDLGPLMEYVVGVVAEMGRK